MSERPALLTLLCLGTMLLGMAGLFGAFFGALNAWQSEQVESAMLQVFAPQITPDQAERHREAAREIRKITDSWSPLVWSLRIVQLLLSPLLILASVQAWRAKPGGRRLLRWVCVAVVVAEMIRALTSTMIRNEVTPIVDRQIAEITQQQQETILPGMGASLQNDMRRMRLIAWFVWMGWFGAKVGILGLTFVYLGRPEVLEYYRLAYEEAQYE